MKRILLIADSDRWIFARHCLEIKNRLPEFSFDIAYTFNKDPASFGYENYDVIYSLDPGMRMTPSPVDKTVIGIRNQFMYDDSTALRFFNKHIRNKCKAFHVLNKNQYEQFKTISAENNLPLLLVPHGVDIDTFKPTTSKTTTFTVGFSGNISSKCKKGVEIMEKVCSKNNIHFIQSGKSLSKSQMPSFYSNIDVYLCMSFTEGLNNPTLEAGAMGIPVISTSAGAAREIIEDGVNGFIVDRTEDALEEKLLFLRDNLEIRKSLGQNLYNTIVNNWSWNHKIGAFRDMFNLVMEN